MLELLAPLIGLLDRILPKRAQRLKDGIQDYYRGAVERKLKRKLERENGNDTV